MKTLFFLLLILVSCAAAWTESNVPAEMDIYPESVRNESSYLTHFYPLGFSESKSYFAYVIYRNVSGGVGYFTYFELKIQNIMTDKIESRLIYDGRYRTDPNEGSYPELYKIDPEDDYLDFETVWIHIQKDIQKILQDFNIIRNDNLELKRFPYTGKNGTEYTVNIETFGNVAVNLRYNSYKVEFLRSEDEKKTIFHNKGCAAMAVDAVGLIESPYEKRVVVIIRETIRGFEGPPHSHKPVIIGSHLEYGF